MQFHPQNDLLLIAKWLHDYKSLREKKRKITFGQISAALTIVYGSSQVSAVTEMVQHSTQLCQFATNFPDPSLKQRNIGMRTRAQRPRMDLMKKSLPRPKTTTAWKLTPHRSKISKNWNPSHCRECVRILYLQVQVYPGELWGLKTAGAHSARSLKISRCKRWCLKDLRVHAAAAPVLMHSLIVPIYRTKK